MEEWRSVVGYEGWYEVSNLGQVRRTNLSHVSTGLPMKQYDNHGYRAIRLSKENVVKAQPIHRLVAFAFIPNPDNKPHINHKNGVRHDNRVENLEWCTPQENIEHAYDVLRVGERLPRGTAHYSAKLTDDQVAMLRQARSEGKNIRPIAKELGVCAGTCYYAIRGQTWRHVPSPAATCVQKTPRWRSRLSDDHIRQIIDAKLTGRHGSVACAARRLGVNLQDCYAALRAQPLAISQRF